MLESVISFVGGRGGVSLLHSPFSNLSGLSSGEEFLFEALHWNLSDRSVGDQSLLNAPS